MNQGDFMKSFSILVFTTSLFFSLSGQADSKTPQQYWSEAGFGFSTLKQLLPDAQCKTNSNIFSACIEAINSVAASSKSPFVLLSAQQLAGNPPDYVGPAIQNFGPLVAAQLIVKDSKSQSRSEAIAAFKKSQQQTLERVLALKQIDGSNAAKVDIAALFDLEEKSLAATTDAPLVASEIFNSFLAKAIDPHTHIQTVAETMDETQAADKSLVGVGASLKTEGDSTIIVKVVDGSPAMAGGLKSKDQIVSINGQPIAGMKIDKVVSLIRGPAGSQVKLEVLRKSMNVSLQITRASVTFPNVQNSVLNDSGKPIGYISLGNFMDNTGCSRIKVAIQQLQAKNVQGLIFDLRGNGGGLLTQAVCIGGLFVGKKVILKVKNLDDGKISDYPADADAVTQLPMVTLIDSGSASASEIVSGALQDYQRSWIAGDRSFGKATVQASGTLKAVPTVQVYQTIQRFYQPSGRTNQVVGIRPDFDIDPIPNATDDDRFATREADLYTNAFTALGDPWQEPRPADVQKIKGCAAMSGKADQLYKQREDDVNSPDYRLLVAEDLLACAI
jgi:carboxyl-terminal processing protease